MPFTVLAGDVGGTNARLALVDVDPDRPRITLERTFPSADYPGLAEVVELFLEEAGDRPARAAFGLAGPVRGRVMRTTNLPWTVDADALEARCGLEQVSLLNDLEATAWGVRALTSDQLRVLHPGDPEARGNGCVIAAGTGLGEAGLAWDGRRHRPFACEGGHTAFAPADEREDRLLAFLRHRHGRVSWERVVSGPGLAAIAEFVHDRRGEPLPEWFRSAEDPAAAVAEAALEERSDAAVEALDLFVRLYGIEAGELALKLNALGGVWVAGGIAPKILPRLLDGPFLDGFLAKGRMRRLVEAMPVRVVLEPRTALLGAALRAAQE